MKEAAEPNGASSPASLHPTTRLSVQMEARMGARTTLKLGGWNSSVWHFHMETLARQCTCNPARATVRADKFG